eukprot:TRINITY_DN6039_c0_g1_i8.p1 TRINITY_DN6039_c0_g1~~TRINITY_DN6039_c0_g1_i8.p1  ORF type:complete len:511 (-),score=82.58 TRINITY_DN6039_c0_g1_i8:19-1551(-)
MKSFLECISQQLGFHLSEDNALLQFMQSEEVGFVISADHQIISFPPWWPNKLPHQKTKGVKRKKVLDVSGKRVQEEGGICTVLPQDILAEILSWMSFEEKRASRLINKQFCQILDSRHLKQILRTKSLGLSVEDLSRWPKVEGIYFSAGDWGPTQLAMVQQLPSITSLALIKPKNLDSEILEINPGVFRNLVSLEIASCPIVDLSQAVHLTSLDVTSCPKELEETLDSVPHPKKISRLHIWSWTDDDQNFQLSLDRFANVTDLVLCGHVRTSTQFHRLEKLSITGTGFEIGSDDPFQCLGSSPIKHLTFEISDTPNTQAEWLMRLPQSITYLEFEIEYGAQMVGDGSKINFPNLQHLSLGGDPSNDVFSMFREMPSIHTVTLDLLDGLDIRLPKSCIRLITKCRGVDFDQRVYIVPRIKHFHLIIDPQFLECKIDTSLVGDFTMSIDRDTVLRPDIALLHRMETMNARFLDPILAELTKSYRDMSSALQKQIDSMGVSTYAVDASLYQHT